MMPRDQKKLWPAMVVEGVGAVAPVLSSGVPSGIVPFIVIMFRVLSALTLALSCGLSSRSLLSAAAAQMTLLPGATRSGLMRLSWCISPAPSVQEERVGPREL